MRQCSNTRTRSRRFTQVFVALFDIYPAEKYAVYLTKALKTKNSKSQAGCLREAARVIEAKGTSVVKVKEYGLVVKALESKDAKVRAVRQRMRR